MKLLNILLITLVIGVAGVFAQTSTITYQGRLTDNSAAASGTYQLRFSLFDSDTGGTQSGTTIELTNVSVSNGVFTVELNFGTAPFPFGATRYLQIEVRRNSGEVYTTLTPRQQVTTTPYSIRSLEANTANNSTQLGGVAANQYVQTNDSRLSDARTPTAGSNNYIQNRTSQQTAANFNIGGVGTAQSLNASVVNASTQFNLNNSSILSSPGTLNTFVGISNGIVNTSGERNTFVGRGTGINNTTGSTNTFVGSGAGFENINGSDNSFYGYNAGLRVTSGNKNSFFGVSAGSANLTGINNSFFGFEAGLNTTNSGNTFIGKSSGETNVSGNNNTLIGDNTDVGSSNVFYGTAIGSGAIVTSVNTIQLGRNGVDFIRIGNLPNAPETLCVQQLLNIPGRCVSSIRYKKDVTDFRSGFDLLNKLRPVWFRWKESDIPDVGLIAEEVAEVEPLLATFDRNGEIQGVKYNRIGVVLINVVKEQQAQIESQAEENKEMQTKIKAQTEQINLLKTQSQKQQMLIDKLQKLVCSSNPQAEICKENEKYEK